MINLLDEKLDNHSLDQELETRLKRGIKDRILLEEAMRLEDVEKNLYTLYQIERSRIAVQKNLYYSKNKEAIDNKNSKEYKQYKEFEKRRSSLYTKFKYKLRQEQDRKLNQKGSLSITIALLLIPFLIITFYLVDGQRLLHTKQTARNIAEEAARTGQVAAKTSLRGGDVNQNAARQACKDYIDGLSINGSCEIVDDNKLKVDVDIDFKPIFPDSLNIHKTISREADLLIQ